MPTREVQTTKINVGEGDWYIGQEGAAIPADTIDYRGNFPNFAYVGDFELAMLAGIHASMLGAHTPEGEIQKWLEERWLVHEQMFPGKSRQEIANRLQQALDTPFAANDITTGVCRRDFRRQSEG